MWTLNCNLYEPIWKRRRIRELALLLHSMEFFLNGAELSLNSGNSGNLIITEAWIGLNVSCWLCGIILVSYTRGDKFELFYCNDKYFCHWIRWHLVLVIVNGCSNVHGCCGNLVQHYYSVGTNMIQQPFPWLQVEVENPGGCAVLMMMIGLCCFW